MKLNTCKKIELPFWEREVAATLTIVVLTNGRVEVQGAIERPDFSMLLIEAGKKRLQAWHAAQARRAARNGGSADEPGAPVIVEGGAAPAEDV